MAASEPYGARMTHIASETIRRCKELSVAVAAIYGNTKFTDGFLEAKRVYERESDGKDS